MGGLQWEILKLQDVGLRREIPELHVGGLLHEITDLPDEGLPPDMCQLKGEDLHQEPRRETNSTEIPTVLITEDRTDCKFNFPCNNLLTFRLIDGAS